MAANSKNRYPADKTGSKYSEFHNTKRRAPGKAKTGQEGGKGGSTEGGTGKA